MIVKNPLYFLVLVVSALFSAPLSTVASEAAEDPDAGKTPSATIAIQKWKVGFIAGVSTGSGVMTYQGKEYPLDIGGIRVGATVGIARADLEGEVYGLKDPKDIEGEFVAAQAAIAVIAGENVWRLKNSGNDVLLRLHGKQKGLDLSLDLGGMTIKLK